MFDLLQYMQQDGYLSANELIALRKTCKELGENPVRLLRSLNIASPEQIQDYLQKHFKLLTLREDALSNLSESYQVFVPIDIALFYSCFGLGEENGITFIAMEDPSDLGLVNQLRFLLGKRIKGVCATVYQLAEGLTKIYNLPLGSLMLTTAIEKSRGVLGGVRYQEAYVNSIDIDNDFAGVGLDNESPEILPPPSPSTVDEDLFPKVENQPPQDKSLFPQDESLFPQDENLFPKAEPKEPPPKKEDSGFLFLDGSSGSIDPSLLKMEEPIFSPPPKSTPSFKPTEEYDLELTLKVSSSVNRILAKLSLIQERENAVEAVNTLLASQQISIMCEGANNFHLKGKDFIISSSFIELIEESHPIYNALIPVFKKIAKLK